MDLYFIARTLDLLGVILISYTAIAVHYRVRKEHKIDEGVYDAMKKEQFTGLLGIGLMITAYVIEIMVKVV